MWSLRDLSERIRAWRRRLARAQQGFTLIEVMVALVLIMIVLVPMSYVMTSSLVTGGCAQQRDAADGLVNQELEEVRALPYTTVAAGDTSNDSTLTHAVDPQITVTSGVYTYTPTGETMPVNSAASSSVPAPLNPHRAAVPLNSTTYTVSTYVTKFGSVSGAYRVVALVSWSGGSCQGGPTSVSGQSVVDEPNAITTPCASDSTHPFPAPCQPFFFSEASDGNPYVSIQPADGVPADAMVGVPIANAELDLPTLDCSLQLEQVATGDCKAVTSGAVLDVSGAAEQDMGDDSTTCSFTSDPSGSATCSDTPAQGTVSALSATGSSNSLALTASSGDSGTLAGETVASGSPSCTDLSGTALTDGQPCDSGSLSEGATMTAVATLSGLGGATLASIGPTTTALKVFNTEAVASGDGGYCSATSGDGCVHAGATRSLGTLALAALPGTVASFVGSNWGCNGYLLEISNFSDTVTAESGVSAATPSAIQNGTTGVLKYWNGTSCTTQAITQSAWGASPPSNISIPAVAITDGATAVSITPSVTYQGTATASNTTNCANTCTASGTSESPLVVNLTYQVTVSGTLLLDVTLHADLGTLAATTSYTKKPGAS